jgi:hypothetical protein
MREFSEGAKMSQNDVDLGGHAIFDLGPISISAIADLEVSVNSLTKAYKEWTKQESNYKYGTVDQPLAGSGTVDARGDNLIFGLEGPNQGYKWEVRRIYIAGTDPTASRGGTAFLTVSPLRPQPNLISALNVIDYVPTIPGPAFYSAGQIVVHAPSRLWVVVVGGDDLYTYIVTGSVQESPDVPVSGRIVE